MIEITFPTGYKAYFSYLEDIAPKLEAYFRTNIGRDIPSTITARPSF